jgi:hypothetical protein
MSPIVFKHMNTEPDKRSHVLNKLLKVLIALAVLGAIAGIAFLVCFPKRQEEQVPITDTKGALLSAAGNEQPRGEIELPVRKYSTVVATKCEVNEDDETLRLKAHDSVFLVRVKVGPECLNSKSRVIIFQGKWPGRYDLEVGPDAVKAGSVSIPFWFRRPGDALLQIIPDHHSAARKGLALDMIRVKIPKGKACEVKVEPRVVDSVCSKYVIKLDLPDKDVVNWSTIRVADVSSISKENMGSAMRASKSSVMKEFQTAYNMFAGRTYVVQVYLNRTILLPWELIRVPDDVAKAREKLKGGVYVWRPDVGPRITVRLKDADNGSLLRVSGNLCAYTPRGDQAGVPIENGEVTFWVGLQKNTHHDKVRDRYEWHLSTGLRKRFELVGGQHMELNKKEIVHHLQLRARNMCSFLLTRAKPPHKRVRGWVYVLDKETGKLLASASPGREISRPGVALRCVAFAKGYAIAEKVILPKDKFVAQTVIRMKKVENRKVLIRAPESKTEVRLHVRYMYPEYPCVPVQTAKLVVKKGAGTLELPVDPERKVVLAIRDWDMKYAATICEAKGADLPETITLERGIALKGTVRLQASIPKEAETMLMLARAEAPAKGFTSALARNMKKASPGSLSFETRLTPGKYSAFLAVREKSGVVYYGLGSVRVEKQGAKQPIELVAKASSRMSQRELKRKFMPVDWD